MADQLRRQSLGIWGALGAAQTLFQRGNLFVRPNFAFTESLEKIIDGHGHGRDAPRRVILAMPFRR